MDKELASLVWKMENNIWADFSCAWECFCWVCWTQIAFHYHLTSGIRHGPISPWLTGRISEQNILLLILFSLGTRGRFHFITELQVMLAAKINHLLKSLTVLFSLFRFYRSNAWLKRKKSNQSPAASCFVRQDGILSLRHINSYQKTLQAKLLSL